MVMARDIMGETWSAFLPTDHKNLQKDHCNSTANVLMMVAGVTETFTKCCLHLFLWPLFWLSGYSVLLLYVYQSSNCNSSLILNADKLLVVQVWLLQFFNPDKILNLISMINQAKCMKDCLISWYISAISEAPTSSETSEFTSKLSK